MSLDKKKLKLQELKIRSFVTDLDNRQQEKIKAGGGVTHPPYCLSGDGNCFTDMLQCKSYDVRCESEDSLCYGVCFSNEYPCENPKTYLNTVCIIKTIIGVDPVGAVGL